MRYRLAGEASNQLEYCMKNMPDHQGYVWLITDRDAIIGVYINQYDRDDRLSILKDKSIDPPGNELYKGWSRLSELLSTLELVWPITSASFRDDQLHKLIN